MIYEALVLLISHFSLLTVEYWHMSVRVNSEFGRLREAIMHRPGRELVRMTPSTRDYFLFDDLLFDEHAQQEHDWLVDILQNHLGVKIHLFENLFTESLTHAS